MDVSENIQILDDERKLKEDILSNFWIDSSKTVNYILSFTKSNFLDWEESEQLWIDWITYSWEEVIENWLNYDKTSIDLINMSTNIAKKFYLIYFSKININELTVIRKNKIIEMIINNNVTERDFRKALTFISNDIECKIQENPTSVNENWAINIMDLSPFMLDNFTTIPRIIKLKNWNLVSIEKNSETPVWTKVFTIRFWIKKENVAYPAYTWICNLIAWNNNYNFTKILSISDKKDFYDDLKELKLYFSCFYTENEDLWLQEVKKWKASTIWEKAIDILNSIKWWFYKAKIFDWGVNEKWYRVLFIQSIGWNDAIFSQLEMNLFRENWKNIIYIWALWKDEVNQKFIKAIPGLLARVRDIFKEFDAEWKVKIWSFKAEKCWKNWVMRKDTIPQIIKRYKPKSR